MGWRRYPRQRRASTSLHDTRVVVTKLFKWRRGVMSEQKRIPSRLGSQKTTGNCSPPAQSCSEYGGDCTVLICSTLLLTKNCWLTAASETDRGSNKFSMSCQPKRVLRRRNNKYGTVAQGYCRSETEVLELMKAQNNTGPCFKSSHQASSQMACKSTCVYENQKGKNCAT